MTEYADLLKKLEEDVSAIKDEGLRRIPSSDFCKTN